MTIINAIDYVGQKMRIKLERDLPETTLNNGLLYVNGFRFIKSKREFSSLVRRWCISSYTIEDARQ